MEYVVPQNIDVEDRVIGPLSLRQFIILLVGGGFILLLFFVMSNVFMLWLLLAILIAAASVGLAFYKYGDRTLENIIISAFQMALNTRKRIWRKERITAKPAEELVKKEPMPKISQAKDPIAAKTELERLARIVDSGVTNGQGPAISANISAPKSEVDIFENQKDETELENLIEKAKAENPKEEVISQMASVSPTQDFNYPKIETKNNLFRN